MVYLKAASISRFFLKKRVVHQALWDGRSLFDGARKGPVFFLSIRRGNDGSEVAVSAVIKRRQ